MTEGYNEVAWNEVVRNEVTVISLETSPRVCPSDSESTVILCEK